MSRLLAEYDALLPTLLELEHELERVVHDLVEDLSGSVHTIRCRVKARESLRGKLARPDRTYRCLTDITDLVGVRVITYFEDSVRDVAERVENGFAIDLERSVDKRRQAEADRFGYRSLHYICTPPDGFFARHDLPAVTGLRFEVQIRTILQHAWAEMEHDLGYKATVAIPGPIRRKLSRLAGLLELADEEFLDVKRRLEAYEVAVASDIGRNASAVGIDKVSLSAFLRRPSVSEADAEVARILGHSCEATPFFPDYLVEMLRFVGLDRADQLEAAFAWAMPRLAAFVPRYFEFASRAWGLSGADVGPIKRGYSVLFVAHMQLLAASRLEVELVDEAARFFATLDSARDDARALAVQLVEATRSVFAP